MILLYIDPGTGSMLFTILIGIIGAAVYGLHALFVKMRVRLSLGKAEAAEDDWQPVVIFSDSKRYWNVFEPVCDELERRGVNVHYMTASEDDPALEKSYEHITCDFIGAENRAFARLNLLKAKILLSTTPGLDVYQWKRSREVRWYVHILHAANDPTGYRMFGLDYYDAVLLSGQYQIDQIRKLEAQRDLPAKELLLVGLPHMDVMKERWDERRAALKRDDAARPGTVLLAPTWGPSSIFNRYGGKLIDALLTTGYRLIIRPHPQSLISDKELIDGLKRDYPDSDRLEWNTDTDNFEALCASDVLISDFSGVIFEFALVFDRPVIYADTSFDKGPYDAYWLDEEMWTFSVLPRIGRQLKQEDLPRIAEVIEEERGSGERREARRQAREETWAHVGESAARTADYLAGKLEELDREKTE